MSITNELENIKKFESVVFSHEQAETLTVIEKAQANGQESLKEFIRNEINNLRVEISNDLKDLLIKIFGIIVGTIGVAVVIIKLF